MKYFEGALDHILSADDVWFTSAEDIYDWFATRIDNGA
jgi:hypothetical protein